MMLLSVKTTELLSVFYTGSVVELMLSTSSTTSGAAWYLLSQIVLSYKGYLERNGIDE